MKTSTRNNIALKSNDFELSRRLVHTLKGVAGTVGADKLSLAAKQFEMVFAEGNTALYEGYLAVMEEKLMAVIATITNMA